MNAGKVPLTPAGRTIVRLMFWPSTEMVFWLTSALGRVSLTPAWAPVSTARASLGESCSIGLPPPEFSASRNACVLCSTPVSVAAKALPTERARSEPARILPNVFMFISYGVGWVRRLRADVRQRCREWRWSKGKLGEPHRPALERRPGPDLAG